MNVSIGNFILIAFLSYLFLMTFSLVVWVWNDVHQRTTDQVFYTIAMILVIVGNIFGVAIYLVIRPRETFKETYYSELEEKIILAQAKSMGIIPEDVSYEKKPERVRKTKARKTAVDNETTNNSPA